MEVNCARGCERWRIDQSIKSQTEPTLCSADGNYMQKELGSCYESTGIRLVANLLWLWDFLKDIREIQRNNQMIKDNDIKFSRELKT